MKLKLMKISVKSFVLIFSLINTIIGFVLGIFVTLTSLFAADEQAGLGAWAILIFPVINGLLSTVASALLAGLFNLFAKLFGGLELEFEPEVKS